MARTIEEIKKEMTDAFMADKTLQQTYGFNPNESFASQFSKVSIESIIFGIIATSIWVLETLFDKHQTEIGNTISKRAHTLTWYRDKALAFQFGKDLDDVTAEYDNTGMTDDEIERQKIVTKCSVDNGVSTYPTLIVKAVTAAGKMTAGQLSAFTAYMNEIADAGLRLNVSSLNPDVVKLGMIVWYDPLLINDSGTLYNENKENIVAQYINDYFAKLPFNGVFYPHLLESYLTTCEGVKMVKITTGSVQYESGTGTATDDITNLDEYAPKSGALILSTDYSGIIYNQF